MKEDFLRLIEEQVVLGDGAIGTYLYEKGVQLGTNTDLLNLKDPDLIYGVHEEYIRAGSQLIETNTFAANRLRLESRGSGHLAPEINLQGARIAVKAAAGKIFVAGSVGPTGLDFPLDAADGEPFSEDLVKEVFLEQMEALAEGGVDLFILETFTHLEELLLAVRTAKENFSDHPVVAQMVFPAKGKTALGLDAVHCATEAVRAGADLFGTNCGRGVKAMIEAVEKLAQLGGTVPLSAFPNAGIPEVIDHRMVYSTPPSYMAGKVAEMVKLGVRLVGGCCGTTPAHIHEFKKRLHVRQVKRQEPVSSGQVLEAGPEAGEAAGPGGLLSGLVPGRLPILVELDPPPHLEVDGVVEGAERLKEAGADAVTLAENPLAVLRCDNLSLAHIIKESCGIETVIHLTCRDRNVLGLQAQIMGAHLLGIRGILAVTGDPASSSDQPGVSGVFDVNSYGLVRMIAGFNRGLNMAGRPMKQSTDFSIGVAFSFRPSKPELQLRRLEKKVSYGANFVMTQPIFDAASIEKMMELTSHLDILIFPGIFPLISWRSAEFLHNELPGITIPQEIRDHLRSYEKLEDQRKAGLELTSRLLDEIHPMVDGLYLISPLNKWEVPLALVQQARAAGWKGTGRADRFSSGTVTAHE